MIRVMAAGIGTLSATALAQQAPLGTPQEARAMLEKAVTAVKTDQGVALAMFNKGEGGFVGRDLNTFCFRIADGKLLASPRAVPAGTDVRFLKDPTGKNFGNELYAAAQKPERQIAEVGPYLFPKPGMTEAAHRQQPAVAQLGDRNRFALDKAGDYKRSLFADLGLQPVAVRAAAIRGAGRLRDDALSAELAHPLEELFTVVADDMTRPGDASCLTSCRHPLPSGGSVADVTTWSQTRSGRSAETVPAENANLVMGTTVARESPRGL